MMVLKATNIAGFEAAAWQSLVAPAGTPAELGQRYNKALVSVTAKTATAREEQCRTDRKEGVNGRGQEHAQPKEVFICLCKASAP